MTPQGAPPAPVARQHRRVGEDGVPLGPPLQSSTAPPQPREAGRAGPAPHHVGPERAAVVWRVDRCGHPACATTRPGQRTRSPNENAASASDGRTPRSFSQSCRRSCVSCSRYGGKSSLQTRCIMRGGHEASTTGRSTRDD